MARPIRRDNGQIQGAPTKYKPVYDEQVFKLCLLGADDSEIADFFEVVESTINLWKIEHPTFSESIKQGKLQADSEIANSLYNRAKGFEVPAVKIFCDSKSGGVTEAPFMEYYPPDPASMAIWLKNRRPKNFKDKFEIEHSGNVSLSSRMQSLLSDDDKK